jgi:hypothetical protein
LTSFGKSGRPSSVLLWHSRPVWKSRGERKSIVALSTRYLVRRHAFSHLISQALPASFFPRGVDTVLAAGSRLTGRRRKRRRDYDSPKNLPILDGKLPLHLRKASPELDWKIRFRIIAAKASRQNRNPNVYSRSERRVRDELLRLGFVEGQSFLHEHRVFGYLGKRGQKVYYWLDFFVPSLLLDLG